MAFPRLLTRTTYPPKRRRYRYFGPPTITESASSPLNLNEVIKARLDRTKRKKTTSTAVASVISLAGVDPSAEYFILDSDINYIHNPVRQFSNALSLTSTISYRKRLVEEIEIFQWFIFGQIITHQKSARQSLSITSPLTLQSTIELIDLSDYVNHQLALTSSIHLNRITAYQLIDSLDLQFSIITGGHQIKFETVGFSYTLPPTTEIRVYPYHNYKWLRSLTYAHVKWERFKERKFTQTILFEIDLTVTPEQRADLQAFFAYWRNNEFVITIGTHVWTGFLTTNNAPLLERYFPPENAKLTIALEALPRR
jgi:hypothetical protein